MKLRLARRCLWTICFMCGVNFVWHLILATTVVMYWPDLWSDRMGLATLRPHLYEMGQYAGIALLAGLSIYWLRGAFENDKNDDTEIAR